MKTLLEVRADNVWEAETVLRKEPEFARVIREGAALRVFVDRREAGERRIRSLLKKHGIRVSAVHVKEPTLENSFVEIVSAGGRG
jgi:hypothetical protein